MRIAERSDAIGILLGDVTSERMPSGKVLLTVPEAAELWRRIGSVNITPGIYRRKCKSGELREAGIEVSDGPRFLTDLDSLLDYFDREWRSIGEKLRQAQDERRAQLEEWGIETEKGPPPPKG